MMSMGNGRQGRRPQRIYLVRSVRDWDGQITGMDAQWTDNPRLARVWVRVLGYTEVSAEQFAEVVRGWESVEVDAVREVLEAERDAEQVNEAERRRWIEWALQKGKNDE